MKRERFAGHHEAMEALVLFCGWGDGGSADREFNVAANTLSAPRCSNGKAVGYGSNRQLCFFPIGAAWAHAASLGVGPIFPERPSIGPIREVYVPHSLS